MTDKELLEKNGWVVECQSPFEIESKDAYSSASNEGAEIVLNHLKIRDNQAKLFLIKDAYQADLINKETFVEKIIETLENYYKP